MAFKPTTQDDFGVLVHLKPGQFLTTQRDLVRLCEEPDIDRCCIQRALEKFKKLGFSIQTSIHKKTIITISRNDIIELIDPNFDPNSIQTRSIKEQRQEIKEVKETTTPQTPQTFEEEKEPVVVVVDFFNDDLKQQNKPADEPISPSLAKIIDDLEFNKKITREFSEEKICHAVEFILFQIINGKKIDNLHGYITWACQTQPDMPKSKEEKQMDNKSLQDKNREFSKKYDGKVDGIKTILALNEHVEIAFSGSSRVDCLNYSENGFEDQFFNMLRKADFRLNRKMEENNVNFG